MKVVIDIDEEMYKYICKHYTGEDTSCLAIKNGLVLPDNFLYPLQLTDDQIRGIGDRYIQLKQERTFEKKTCKDCIHSGFCYKENDYDNFPDRCGSFIDANIISQGDLIKPLTELCDRYCKNCPIPDVPDECTDCIITHIRGIINRNNDPIQRKLPGCRRGSCKDCKDKDTCNFSYMRGDKECI